VTGLEILEGIRSGTLPPPGVAVTLGMGIDHIERGRVVFTLEPGAEHGNPLGTMHGGVIATLLDSAMGCAVHSTLQEGDGYTTLELKVNYVRPVLATTGRIRAEGSTIHVGRRVATAEGRVLDEGGRLYAHATTTCLIFGEEG
jgi:uncharacterized protein (TIGR00369 family)